ncbi:MAG: hypothetical protein U9R75_05590 [Candidatus Thermoplasmatota archaeon]|nr:hypothetical protein [Candidatus Thermoplasmatota archaeon]
MDWSEEIAKWLKEGKEGAENLLDYPWDIRKEKVEGQEDKALIVASHPKIPFNIEVVVGKHFANLVINPVIPTDAMDPTERMRLYKKLLHLNTDLNLMKAGLVGYDDKPIIQVDLDFESLSYNEFNDALSLLIVGAQNLINIMGLTQEMQEFMANRFIAIIAAKLQEGETVEQIQDFLVNRGGLDDDSAKQLITQTSLLMKKKEEKTERKTSTPGPMYG